MLKANAPLALVLRSLAPLFSRTTVPESPEMVPPTAWVGTTWFTQATETLVTSAVPTVPEGFVTVQVHPVGLVLTVTL